MIDEQLLDRFTYRLVEVRERAILRVTSGTHSIVSAVDLYKTELRELVDTELSAVIVAKLGPDLLAFLKTRSGT